MTVDGRTTMEQMLAHAVNLNGILVPLRSVESSLGRYAECLIIQNKDPIYQVSLGGSATALRIETAIS